MEWLQNTSCAVFVVSFNKMTASEIQNKILIETGLKTSVKKYSVGSMKGYVRE